MRLGIVGFGKVGKHLHTLFSKADNDIIIFDKYLNTNGTQEEINDCDIVFICVPTPSCPDGTCDLSAVNEVVSWIKPPMCIKSTVVPGTTDTLACKTGKRIVFSPEYYGETTFHKYRVDPTPELVAVGGDPDTCEIVLEAYRRVLGPEPRYFQTDALTAELAKYMENCFFAAKVAFVGQFYLLAKSLGANFTQMREIWLADTRIGRSHSTVIDKPGFGGSCLPKDLAALVKHCECLPVSTKLLSEIKLFNEQLRNN